MGVEGYLRVAEISQEHIADAREALSESAEIEAKITSIERKNRRISLSMKSLEIDLEDEVIQEYSGRTTSGGMTLGDKLKEQLSKVESDS